MGLPPAYLFVVRHGNRLDAADKKWHLSSPTPYDPPLTYGGFHQARQVGHQIGTILEQLRADETPCHVSSQPRRRKRYRVVVHTSPFLRCIQTSIGLSTGLSQSTPDFSLDPFDVVAPPLGRAPLRDGSQNHKSTVLRIDSFLGEWLSPEYFEHITPPPSSSLMLGTAKADLLRREDYTKHAHLTKEPLPQQAAQTNPKTTGALWSSPTASPVAGNSDRGSPTPESGSGPFDTSALARSLHKVKKGYLPPRPTYAAAGGGKIPDGIVADGRDECALVDYQWDSTREPLGFGDNGELGEEWSSMHKRFRAGAEKMIKWYWDHEEPERPVSHVPSSPELLRARLATEHSQRDGDDPEEEDEDEDVETVVVIVTHGAGCNALIGAITHQPVLMDVGLASITMASRKPGVGPRTGPAASEDSPPVRLDNIYDIRLSASTEHLRSDMSTPTSGRRASGPVSGFHTSAPMNGGSRARTSTYSSGGAPPSSILGSFEFAHAPTPGAGMRSSSASAATPRGAVLRRDSGPLAAPTSLDGSGNVASSALSSIGYGAIAESGTSGGPPSPAPAPAGLWAPRAPTSTLSLTTAAPPTEAAMRKTSALASPHAEEDDVFSNMPLSRSPPSKMRSRDGSLAGHDVPASTPSSIFSSAAAPATAGQGGTAVGNPGKGPVLAAPIKLNTRFGGGGEGQAPQKVGILEDVDEVAVSEGLWGVPTLPDEAERFRDLSLSKRRWTVNERT